jgi:hypothetical protein
MLQSVGSHYKVKTMRTFFTIRYQLVFSVLLVILVFASCKKKSDETISIDPSTSLIKTIIQKNTSGVVFLRRDYQYDNQRRIISQKLSYPEDSAEFTYKYEYLPSLVIVKFLLNDTILKNKSIYHLNILGLATEVTHFAYFTNLDSITGPNSLYQYNSEGYMTEMKDFNKDSSLSQSYTSQIIGWNVSSLVLYRPSWGPDVITETYTYIPNSINSAGNSNMGMPFLGKSNTNLIEASVLTSAVVKTATFTYSYDTFNRVLTTKITGGTMVTISPSELSYTYY